MCTQILLEFESTWIIYICQYHKYTCSANNYCNFFYNWIKFIFKRVQLKMFKYFARLVKFSWVDHLILSKLIDSVALYLV